MKSILMWSLVAATTLLSRTFLFADAINTTDWINKHASSTTSENINHDANGNILSIVRTKDSTVSIRETRTETQKPDKSGNLIAVSRVISCADTHGNSTTTTQALLPGKSDLATTSVTTVNKTPNGTATKIFERNIEDKDTADWIDKHSASTTTEHINRGPSGNILSLVRTRTTTVYIKQIITETQKPDKFGKLVTVSRVTSCVDTHGSSATTTETLLPGKSALVTTAVTTVDKTPNSTTTIVYERDKSGEMTVVSQTTITTKKDDDRG